MPDAHRAAYQANNKSMEADAAEIRERAEYRLGEMLAPVIGNGFVMNPPADLGIDKRLANKARKTFALPKQTFEAALTERRRQILANTRVLPLLTIAKRLQAQAQRQAIQTAATAAMPPLMTDRYRLIHADMASTNVIEFESVDAIVTDPPWTQKYLACFDHLARRAPEWLKPGGSMLIMSGQSYLPEVFAALTKSGLTYRWPFCCLVNTGMDVQVFDRNIIPKWRPVLWYTKGGCKHLPWRGDIIPADAPDKRFHPWGQSVKQFEWMVELTSLPGQLILDPFCGGGTTGVAALRLGRQFIGLDIDKNCIEQTAARLKPHTYRSIGRRKPA